MELDIENKSEVLFEIENIEESAVNSKDVTSNGETDENIAKAKISVSDNKD